MGDLGAIFKAYDIRGRVADELDVDTVRRIGAAFAAFTHAQTVAVGRDCRVSSPSLAAAFIDGALRQGSDVTDLGEIPTDVAYYYSGHADVPAAVITASHNPPAWNGIKLCGPGAVPIGVDTGLDDIRRLASREPPPERERGRSRRADPIPGYVEHVLGIVDTDRIADVHVIADGGNGMAGVVLPRVFDRLPARLTGLYLEPDGTFPNHPADPLRPENLVDLLHEMKERRGDLGVAFDGDADRAFFVDDRLEPLSGSTTTALIATWFLQKEPGAKIVHNLITSRAVPESVRAAGGEPIRTRVGHSYIKQVMAETGAAFGGEHSGHYYFRDNYRADSGIVALLVLLQVLSEAGRPLSELRRSFEPYVQSGEINLRVAEPQGALDAVERSLDGEEIDRLDGLTISWPDRWFNLRPSNTEPVLRLNVEAGDRETVDDLVARIREVVEATG